MILADLKKKEKHKICQALLAADFKGVLETHRLADQNIMLTT